MAVQIINKLKCNGYPEAKHNDEEHTYFVRVIDLLGEQEVTNTKQEVLAVEDDIVDQIA
jgi:hypothetical protein